MSRMRTVEQTVTYFKEKDPLTAVNPTMLRRLINQGTIKHVKVGSKKLINLDWLEEWLLNPVEISEPTKSTGVLRKII